MEGNCYNIFMLGHKMRVGKDTFADYVCSDLDNTAKKFNFAVKMKEIVGDLYGFSEEQLYGALKEVGDQRYPKENGTSFWTPREVLIKFGQEQNAVSTSIWAGVVFRQIEEIIKKNERSIKTFIVADFRFKWEFEAAQRFVEKFKIEHPNDRFFLHAIKIERPSLKEWCFDRSEIDLVNFNEWSAVLVNDGSLEQYQEKVTNIYNSLLKE